MESGSLWRKIDKAREEPYFEVTIISENKARVLDQVPLFNSG